MDINVEAPRKGWRMQWWICGTSGIRGLHVEAHSELRWGRECVGGDFGRCGKLKVEGNRDTSRSGAEVEV